MIRKLSPPLQAAFDWLSETEFKTDIDYSPVHSDYAALNKLADMGLVEKKTIPGSIIDTYRRRTQKEIIERLQKQMAK